MLGIFTPNRLKAVFLLRNELSDSGFLWQPPTMTFSKLHHRHEWNDISTWSHLIYLPVTLRINTKAPNRAFALVFRDLASEYFLGFPVPLPPFPVQPTALKHFLQFRRHASSHLRVSCLLCLGNLTLWLICFCHISHFLARKVQKEVLFYLFCFLFVPVKNQ